MAPGLGPACRKNDWKRTEAPYIVSENLRLRVPASRSNSTYSRYVGMLKSVPTVLACKAFGISLASAMFPSSSEMRPTL